MKNINYTKIKKVRELEYALTGSHTNRMYEKGSHRRRKDVIEELLLKYKDRFCTGNVLDYGCAEGLYCKFMRDRGFRKVFGCDISTSKIKEAKRKYGNEGIVFFDTENFGKNRKYKLILCAEVLQHIPNYIDTLNLFKRVLCKDGFLLISIPNLSKKEKHEFADIDDSMTAEELLREIGGAGFGRQNAIWKFNSARFFHEMQKDFNVVRIKKIDTPDGKIRNLWTVGLLRKKQK